MGQIYSSLFGADADGCLKSITEPIAFPATIANQSHQRCDLTLYENMHFYKYQPAGGSRALVFCHGNAMTVNPNTIGCLKQLADHIGITIYMVEYPGYGESAELGTVSVDSCAQVVSSMVDYITNIDHIPTKDIYLMGHSIGTGVVSRYAYTHRNEPYAGLILLAPYKSILEVVIDNELAECSSSSLNFFRTKNVIPEISCPILIIHGHYDEVIPVSHGLELARLNRNATFIELATDHCRIIGDTGTFDAILNFV
jgi:pimeloyl-ACP methyl ester carboxylesterase